MLAGIAQLCAHHIYLDVAGKSFTDITIQAETLRSELYNCPDRFGIAAQTSDISFAVVRTKKYMSVNYKPQSTLKILLTASNTIAVLELL